MPIAAERMSHVACRMSHVACRVSRLDTAWLRMGHDVKLMMVVGVWLLTPTLMLPWSGQDVA